MSSVSCPVDLDTKTGGRLQLADIAVKEELSDSIRQDYELWAP